MDFLNKMTDQAKDAVEVRVCVLISFRAAEIRRTADTIRAVVFWRQPHPAGGNFGT